MPNKIKLCNIDFYLEDEDGNEILDDNGSLKIFNADYLDFSTICEHVSEEDLIESKEIRSALPLENLIKIKAWQNMYYAHGEHNYEWEDYPASAHDQIKLMNVYYSQAERIVAEVLEHGN